MPRPARDVANGHCRRDLATKTLPICLRLPPEQCRNMALQESEQAFSPDKAHAPSLEHARAHWVVGFCPHTVTSPYARLGA